jgi:hypothetical protein
MKPIFDTDFTFELPHDGHVAQRSCAAIPVWYFAAAVAPREAAAP